MTTIAYRNGELAGDSRITDGDTVLPERCKKVFKFRDGRLFGASGSSEGGEVLRNATEKRLPTPKLRDTKALLIMPDGKLFCYEGLLWTETKADYAAIGNGAEYALGAMAFGATAKEAVKIGCKLDTHSGGRVYVVRLGKGA